MVCITLLYIQHIPICLPSFCAIPIFHFLYRIFHLLVTIYSVVGYIHVLAIIICDFSSDSNLVEEMNRDVCRYQIVTTGPDYGRLDFHHMVEVWPAIMWHGGVTKKVIKMIIVNNYNTMDNVSLGLKSKLR